MLRSKKEYFRLDLRGSSFEWHWLPREITPPRPDPQHPCTWTSTVDVGQKHTTERCKIELHTSIVPVPPGEPPAILSLCGQRLTDVARTHIHVPLLKSALQKNVRRCRAQAAVRCAVALLQTGAKGFVQFIRLVPVHATRSLTHSLTKSISQSLSHPQAYSNNLLL